MMVYTEQSGLCFSPDAGKTEEMLGYTLQKGEQTGHS